ncbi:MAG TPA: 5-(carboxyamino)imidazole ribonucleotide synthase [Chitinophagaceae bacterium]|nr:5-(carboxyamino)imidazole ribonucleotide synthase [Chitinophagaceae bacterium]
MQKVGILGGGQLGRMLLQAAANYPVETFVMENDNDCPAANLCNHFIKGDIKNFDDVYNFGKDLDAITIEIESVNEEALQKLENEGVRVFPGSSALSIIKNKILQKEFYKTNEIPTAEFVVTKKLNDLVKYPALFPAIHKIALGGYDGRGVTSIKNKEDFVIGFDEDAVLERRINIEKEISIIVASNGSDMAVYPPVEMIFHPVLNLLDYQLSPADLDEQTIWKLEAIATKVVNNLNSPGIFAVEMFIDKENNIWVNETAPRVHNSGHHTIEANYSSQFDMLWRIMLGYPLGNTKHILPAAIVNILGEENSTGDANYLGLEHVLRMENVFVHIYGKKQTKPGRKMGHVTILSNERQELIRTAHKIKQNLKVIGT